jgi:sodium transport system permease protein
VWAVALTTAFVNISSLALTTARLLRSSSMTVPAESYLLTAAMLVPITFITAALFIAVAVFARDFKDGQNFLTPVYMALVLPAGATMLPGVELNAWTAFVPIVNIALLVKSALIGEWRPDLVFLTLLSSAAFAALAMLLAVRVFEREQVLLGGRDSARGLLGLDRRAGGLPSPPVAVTTFALVMVLAFYASLLLEGRGLLTSLLSVQYGFFLLPALLVVLGLGYSARDTFSLRAPSAVAVVAAVLIGVSAWIGVGGLVMRVAPPPDSLVKALERVLMLDDTQRPLWVLWLAIAVTPAICEELFFRGLVMSGLRGLGAAGAIGVSAVLFALAHASIYRLLPTLALGLILGYVVWRSGSIVAGMIVHALNNGLIASATHAPDLLKRLGVGADAVPVPLMVAGLAVTGLGLALITRAVPRRPPAAP